MSRLVDIALATTCLVVLAPLMAVVALAVWLSMGRPVFFRQQRPGLHARLFTLYKFRTMHPPVPGSTGDAGRVTRLGSWLRRTSLDELPQLYNVLRGEMSFVGPRPLLPEYLPYYTKREALRHDVRPGLTGWAQVHGRNDVPWPERLAMDAWYAEHRTWWLDVQILARTPAAVMCGQGVSQRGRTTVETLSAYHERLTAVP